MTAVTEFDRDPYATFADEPRRSPQDIRALLYVFRAVLEGEQDSSALTVAIAHLDLDPRLKQPSLTAASAGVPIGNFFARWEVATTRELAGLLQECFAQVACAALRFAITKTNEGVAAEDFNLGDLLDWILDPVQSVTLYEQAIGSKRRPHVW